MNKYLSQFGIWLSLAGAALLVAAAGSSAWAAAARTKIIVVVPHRILFTVALPVYIAQEKASIARPISMSTPCSPAAARMCKPSSPAMPKSASAPAPWRSSARS